MEAITCIVAMSAAMAGGGSKSTAALALVGTWKVELSKEVRDVAHKMGMPEPQAQFVFKPDNSFTFSSNGASARNCSGTYELYEHTVRLNASGSGWPSGIPAELKSGDHQLTVDGLCYSKSDSSSNGALVGLWTLRSGSGEDRSIKMEFKPDGSFAFTGQFATSKGKYTFEGGQITLLWTEVDNEKVPLGSIHKTLSLKEDGSFMIDTFRYEKG